MPPALCAQQVIVHSAKRYCGMTCHRYSLALPTVYPYDYLAALLRICSAYPPFFQKMPLPLLPYHYCDPQPSIQPCRAPLVPLGPSMPPPAPMALKHTHPRPRQHQRSSSCGARPCQLHRHCARAGVTAESAACQSGGGAGTSMGCEPRAATMCMESTAAAWHMRGESWWWVRGAMAAMGCGCCVKGWVMFWCDVWAHTCCSSQGSHGD